MSSGVLCITVTAHDLDSVLDRGVCESRNSRWSEEPVCGIDYFIARTVPLLLLMLFCNGLIFNGTRVTLYEWVILRLVQPKNHIFKYIRIIICFLYDHHDVIFNYQQTDMKVCFRSTLT